MITPAPLRESYRHATPGYRYQFPRDHFSHPEFQTEWWYYTGNLRTREGRRFGFELTFFRSAVERSPEKAEVWDVRDVWLAHLALSDVEGKRFLHNERWNRTGPELAGAEEMQSRVWNGNWQVKWKLDSSAPGGFHSQQLEAQESRFALRLHLQTGKPPVIHGKEGVQQKGPARGEASHYVSLTRLETTGTVKLDGIAYQVQGLTWMDHEIFTHQLGPELSGWDWFSLQMKDGSELMVYQLRRKDGTADSFSGGTYVSREGQTTNLAGSDLQLSPGATWTSPATHARYPVAWKIAVPRLKIQLDLTTPLRTQELTSRSSAVTAYWEGAVDVNGSMAGKPLAGSGYLEMTGYAGKVRMGE